MKLFTDSVNLMLTAVSTSQFGTSAIKCHSS